MLARGDKAFLDDLCDFCGAGENNAAYGWMRR